MPDSEQTIIHGTESLRYYDDGGTQREHSRQEGHRTDQDTAL